MYRETVTVAMTSATVETFVIADTDGAQTGDAGEVRWTSWTTDDVTAPTAGVALDVTDRDWLTFDGFAFYTGRAQGTIEFDSAQNCKLRRCYINGTLVLNQAPADPGHHLIEQCWFTGLANGIYLHLPGNDSADFDTDIVVQNCVFMGCEVTAESFTGSFAAGGLLIRNCSFFHGNIAVVVEAMATSIPSRVENCIIDQPIETALFSDTSGALVEDYNLIVAATPRVAVAAGANSVSDGSVAPLWEKGHEFGATGRLCRPYGMPIAGSPLLRFGNASGGPTTDILGAPRPPTLAHRAVGAYERSNTAVRETTTTHTGANALRFDGPGYHDFHVPVSATSTTITAQGRYDSTYAGSLPQMLVLNGTEAGVADASDTMTAAANTWEELSINFTPTSAGIVTVRFLSRDTNGAGKFFFDTFGAA